MMWRMALPALAGVALFAATAYQAEIAQWRRQQSLKITYERRPDLLETPLWRRLAGAWCW